MDTEDLRLNYFLGKIPLTSQKASELEKTSKFHYNSNTGKENASVL